jgi:retron-type reverse transcriptase
MCQQALLNRLEPILESVFDEASFGYRRGRSAKEALRKIWCEIEQGHEGIIDANLKDFFGSAVHEKLMVLLTQRIADGYVLAILESIMKVSY